MTPEETERLGEDYQALRQDAGVIDLARDFIRVSGPQALEYLQGQLSQDLEKLAVGDSALSLILEPQGKVSALVRVTRAGGEEWVLDFDGGFAEAVLARLQRFKLRTKADIEVLGDWRCQAVRGPRATEAMAGAGSVGLRSAFPWPGLEGVDLLGPVPVAPEGVRPCGRGAYEVVRIEAGLPVMGAELDEKTIPEESGAVGATVSFTKGCFTGQELVARIDSRGGNVPRRLRGVVLAVAGPGGAAAGAGPGGLFTVGAAVMVDGSEVGHLTSTAVSPVLGPVALAYIKRGHEVPFRADLAPGSAVEVRALPLGGL
ncbi:MAG: CAF17-like 4Fe-4S cluster assembly/insertion protein YgfZ [Acidimicrobiales bacterium]